MNTQNSNDFIKEQVENLLSNLLDTFRIINAESKWYTAVELALNHIERLSLKDPKILEKRIIFLASSLKSGVDPESLKTFARDAINAALLSGFFKKNDITYKNTSLNSLNNLAKISINDSLKSGASKDEAVRRAANQLFLIKKQEEQKLKKAALVDQHPLSEHLSGIKYLGKKLAKEDIRNQLLNLKKDPWGQKNQTGLFSLLVKTGSFRAHHLYKLLGDELFFLCKPIGFVDKNETILLLETPSHAHQNLLSFKKAKILELVKKDQVFAKVSELRFRIKAYG